MNLFNSLTEKTDEKLEKSKSHATCATCMTQKSLEWMCDPGMTLWKGAEKLLCYACSAKETIKLYLNFAACVNKKLPWGTKEQFNMRMLGMVQVLAYEFYTEAVRNRELTQQVVKKKWEKLMIENRK